MKRTATQILTLCAVAATSTLSGTLAHAQGRCGDLRVGILGAANYNYVDAATQNFVAVAGNPGFTSHDFSKIGGFGAYGGIMGEYLFNDMLGVTLRAAADMRDLRKEVDGSTFNPHLLYINIEPGLRVNLGMPELHAMVGGTVAIKGSASYDYTPRSGEQTQKIDGAEMNNVRDVAFGAWLGFGYDICLAKGAGSKPGWYLTPFVEGNYLFDQKKADVPLVDDTKWNTLTARAGVELKMQF